MFFSKRTAPERRHRAACCADEDHRPAMHVRNTFAPLISARGARGNSIGLPTFETLACQFEAI